MSERLKFIKVIAFAADNYVPSGDHPAVVNRQLEIYLPVEAISHLTADPMASGSRLYRIHLKPNFPMHLPFPVKSIHAGHIPGDQIDIFRNTL